MQEPGLMRKEVASEPVVANMHHAILEAWKSGRFLKDPTIDADELIRRLVAPTIQPPQVLETFQDLHGILEQTELDTMQWKVVVVVRGVLRARKMLLPKELFLQVQWAAAAHVPHVWHEFEQIFDYHIPLCHRAALREWTGEERVKLAHLYCINGGREKRIEVRAALEELYAELRPKLSGRRTRVRAKTKKLRSRLRMSRSQSEIEALEREIADNEQDIELNFPHEYRALREKIRPLEEVHQTLTLLELREQRLQGLLRR